MWARVVEVMLACWLAISPFVFRYESGEVLLWANDLSCAALLVSVALLSFHGRLSKLHLAQLAVALWLIGLAFATGGSPPPPGHQNYVVVGLLLGMFAIVPSRATEPSRAWREFYEEHGQT